MYVCNCQGIRETEISQTIRSGATTLRALRQALGVGSGCGKCVCEVRDQLHRELSVHGCTGCGECKRARTHVGAGVGNAAAAALC